jgi:formaldehyde-activating enzyme involved in methanogenesis
MESEVIPTIRNIAGFVVVNSQGAVLYDKSNCMKVFYNIKDAHKAAIKASREAEDVTWRITQAKLIFAVGA